MSRIRNIQPVRRTAEVAVNKIVFVHNRGNLIVGNFNTVLNKALALGYAEYSRICKALGEHTLISP